MPLGRINDEDLAQASYFIGCQAKGEAIVVDPRRDIRLFLDLAAGDVFADTRSMDEIHAGTVPGVLAFPSRGKVATHIAWGFDPEADGARIIFLARDAEDAEDMRHAAPWPGAPG